MGSKITLMRSVSFGGYIGWCDSLSSIYSVYGKTSNFATLEQNRNLEGCLLIVYKAYLESVASTNNGRY
jgi:hypothetical protein